MSPTRSCSVWQWRRIVVYVLLHDYVNVRVFNLQNPHHTGHIENYKQHTAGLQLVALFLSHLPFVQFFGSQTQAGWWCVLLGSDPSIVSTQYLLRFGLSKKTFDGRVNEVFGILQTREYCLQTVTFVGKCDQGEDIRCARSRIVFSKPFLYRLST